MVKQFHPFIPSPRTQTGQSSVFRPAAPLPLNTPTPKEKKVMPDRRELSAEGNSLTVITTLCHEAEIWEQPGDTLNSIVHYPQPWDD